MRFKDRKDAGQKLAERLIGYKDEHPLILALPRGGVPVAYEVAKTLKAPLDTLVVRKIGAPFDPEFGVGAIAPGLRHARAGYSLAEAGDVIMIDNKTLTTLGLTKQDIDPIIEKEMREMERRVLYYRSGQYSQDARADTVIIIDDGLATGVTARAAIESVLIQQKPLKLIFAAPVCAKDSAEALRNLVDVVCLQEIENFGSVGYWYENFPQTSDKQVVELLERAKLNVTGN